MGETGSFREVGNDFTAFDMSIVVFINEEGPDDNENPVNIKSGEAVELVEDMINNLDEQVAFLILKSALREEGEDLSKSHFADGRGAVHSPGELLLFVRDLQVDGMGRGP